MAGKGDKPRPMKVSKNQFDENWEKAFRKGQKALTHLMPEIPGVEPYDKPKSNRKRFYGNEA